MFNSIISETGLDLESASICIATAIILGFIIALVHMKTSRYTNNFVITLSILPILVAVVMIMVNGNVGTGVAIAGAFSLVRFRSMPGNAKEIVSVFWAMAIGISIGMGQVFLASAITLVVSLLLILFYITKFGESNQKTKMLSIVIPEDLDYQNVLDDILKKHLYRYELYSIKTTNLGSLYELKYEIILNKKTNIKELIDELRIRNGNLKICIHNIQKDELL